MITTRSQTKAKTWCDELINGIPNYNSEEDSDYEPEKELKSESDSEIETESESESENYVSEDEFPNESTYNLELGWKHKLMNEIPDYDSEDDPDYEPPSNIQEPPEEYQSDSDN